MDDVQRMDVFDGQQQLRRICPDGIDAFRRLHFVQMRKQLSAHDQLHNEVQATCVRERIEQFGDERMAQ